MKTRRVLMLTTGFPRWDGDLFGAFVFEQARALVGRGLSVDVLAPHQRGIARREQVQGLEVYRFRYAWPARLQQVAYGGGIPTNLRRSWWARLQVPFFLLGYGWGARRRAGDVDIVHCHWTVSGLVALWALGRRKKRVLSVRGSDINMLSGGFMQRVNRAITSRMDRLVAVSEDIAEKLVGAGIDRSKITVLYNGVDARFQPGDRSEARRQFGLPEEPFMLLFVGLLVPVKGVEVLLEALAGWNDTAAWTCLLVGDGPLQGDLEARCAEWGIADRVRFVGRRSSAEIPRWMQAADVLVLPSFSEGRPNVVLEAQACGLPVVATRVGGTPELIQDGKTGLLVEAGQVEPLRHALRSLYENRARCRAIGSQARAHIEEGGHTWEDNAAALDALYDEVLEER